jgi:hypothetical protein
MHPVEGRINVGEKIAARTSITIIDARSNTFDAPGQTGVAAHQADRYRIADVDACKRGFLEISLDPCRVRNGIPVIMISAFDRPTPGIVQ